jgi:hypothetical protein
VLGGAPVPAAAAVIEDPPGFWPVPVGAAAAPPAAADGGGVAPVVVAGDIVVAPVPATAPVTTGVEEPDFEHAIATKTEASDTIRPTERLNASARSDIFTVLI